MGLVAVSRLVSTKTGLVEEWPMRTVQVRDPLEAVRVLDREADRLIRLGYTCKRSNLYVFDCHMDLHLVRVKYEPGYEIISSRWMKEVYHSLGGRL